MDSFENDFTGILDGGEMDDFHERINPHELKGESREAWISDLWAEFVELSRHGVITLFDAKRIAEDMRVDGEESFLDNSVPLEERQSISFPRLIDLLDNMSKASSEEYRDLDLERNENVDQVQYLGPIDYIVHLCKRKSSSSEEGDTTEADTVQYKLKLTGNFEITPKIVLLASTGTLMMLICVAIITGLALMWKQAANEQEKLTLKNFQGAVQSLVVTLERELLAQHTLAMVDQGRIFGAWTEIITNDEREEHLKSLEASAHRKVDLLDSLTHSYETNSEESVLIEVLRAYEEVGAPSLLPSESVAPALGMGAQPCSKGGSNIPLTQASETDGFCYNLDSDGIKTRDKAAASSQFIAMTNEAEKDRRAYGTTRSWPFSSSLSIIGTTAPQPRGSILTHNAVDCIDAHLIGLCDDLTATVVNASTSSLPNVTGKSRYFWNQTNLFSAAMSDGSGLAIVASTKLEDFLQAHRQRTVDVVDHLNFNFIRSTEIVVALKNQTTKEIIHQATKFRFEPGCFFECERFPPSTTNIVAGFDNHGFGWSITPDYRPEPVVGAYAYVASDLDMVLCLERDVLEIRGLSFNFITNIVNSVNSLNPGSLELELVGFTNMTLMKQFYAYEECPLDKTDCLIDPKGVEQKNESHGIIFRYDCKHCQRVTEFQKEHMTLYTSPKKYQNSSCTSCRAALPSSYRDILESEAIGNHEGNDYSGDSVIATYGYLINYSTALVAKVDRQEVFGPVDDSINLSVGCGILFLVSGMVLLVTLSHRAFDAIEHEWGSYKRQIEREQARFASLVKGVIPPAVAERLMRGSKVIFDYVPVASFAFVDICGFTNYVKHWSAKHIARLATYCITVMEEVCQSQEVTKLRTIGDLFTCVALREEKHKAVMALHPVRRCMEVSGILMHLFSPHFAHYPHTVRAFRDIFKECIQENKPTIMPPIRIGVHCGPSVSGAFTIGSASHYDFYGIGPSLANRMQQTASPGRIHATMMVKELLKTRDPDRNFIFDAARKTVVRGQGTITSYFVKAMAQPVPESVTQALGIQRAVERKDLAPKKERRGLPGERQSRGSGSSRSSYRSRRSSVASHD